MKKIYKFLAFSLIIFCGWNTNALAQFYTFSYTGGAQSWTVPPGILTINVFAQGGAGGLNSDPVGHTDSPGHGGCVAATFTVTPGQVITINTGGRGGNGVTSIPGPGGFNGGGIGGTSTLAVPHYSGGGGGGASDIRFGATRMLIAAGGGGAGLLCGGMGDNGGDGGGLTGSAGMASCPPLPVTTASGPGTPSGGGIGGNCVACLGITGFSGTGFTGGAAGTGSAGGGGGAGLWGGGGGQFVGGGGGSSYTDPSATGVVINPGCNTGAGLVQITAVCTPGTVTATPSVICEGSTLTVSDGVLGGTWTSSNTAVATVGSSSGIVTGVYGGTAIITYNIGPCTATTTISVNATPKVIPNFAECAGQTTALSDSIGGGTWLSSNTLVMTVDPGGNAFGVSTGVVIIKYTAGTGCFTTLTATVNALPPAISGPDSVCQGATTTLSDVGLGTWMSSNTALATISGAGLVNGILSTGALDTITYTLPTGCLITTTLMVNPLPAAVTGPDTLCVGSVILLSDPTSGGTWNSTPAFVAAVGATSGFVTGLSPGVSTICYKLTLGGCSSCMPVTVYPLPSFIVGPYRVCEGNNTTLSDASAGGIWSISNTNATIGPVSGTVNGVIAGTAVVTYTLSTGGCFITHTFTVDPLPSTIVGVPIVCAGSSITLSDGSAGTWTSSNTSVATVGLFSGIVTGTGISGGTSTITFTTAFGCQAFQAVTVNPLAPVSGPTSVCFGGTITMSDATGGGTWGSTNTSVATIDLILGTVTTASIGITNICYTTSLGCVACTVVSVTPTPTIIGSGNVCMGQTTLLSDTNPGGTWTSSNTFVATVGSSTGVVFGVSLSTATITYTLGTGCSTTMVVTVNALPPAISGVLAVCQGQTTCLSDGLSGGTWSGSGTTIAFIGSAGCVTGLGGGTMTVSYTMPTGCYAAATVTVNPLPSNITGPTKVCVGSTVSLTDVTGGGTWTSSNTLVATVGTSGSVFGSTAGSATITYTLTTTGCTTTFPITVNALPVAISGTFTLCGPASTILSDATGGGSWTASNTSASIGLFSGTLTGTQKGGLDTITYTVGSTGCMITTTVLINPLSPITGGDSVCAGSSITLFDATFGGGGTWSSSNTGVATVGLISGIVVSSAVGTSTICYNLATGCQSCIAFTVNPLPATPTGPSFVCMGQTILLSDASGGGTWISSNTALATVGLGSGIVTGVSFGSVIMTYTLSTGCNVVYPLFVRALGPITGTFSVCPGDSVQLSDSVVGGTWTSSLTNIATIGSSTAWTTGVITTGGVTTITYLTLDGCIATHSFTVNPLPNPILGNATLCIGQTSQLTDAGGGTWSSSSTCVTVTSGGLVTAIAVPGAVITYTLPTGCINVKFVSVGIPPVGITSSTGSFVVCQGQTFTVSDATLGGSWTSSNTTIATVGTGSGLVTGKSGGTATITYTLGSGCTAIVVVTVNPILPITGVPSACVGLTTQLTDAVGGGNWTSSNSSVATVDGSGLVTGLSGGTSTICYTTLAGCSACTTVTIVTLPLPISGATFVLCTGGTVTLSDGVGPGTWTSSNTNVATVLLGTGVVNTAGVIGGTSTITYTVGTGCYVTQTITVNPITPITGPTQVCIGNTISLTDATGGGTWTSSNTNVANVDGSGNITTVGVIGGTSTITYELATGCMSTLVITVNPLPAPITGPTEVCLFSSITLSDITPGGAWINLSPAIIGVVANVITGNNPGVGIVEYKIISTGCFVTYSVTVDPLPTAIIGPTSVCIGGSVTLSDATAGGTWTSSNTFVANIGSSSGIVISGVLGTSTIRYTLTTTGCSISTTFTVNPYPNPITGPNEVCGNANITLSEASGPGTWTTTNTSIATAASTVPIYSGLITGVAGSGGGVVTIVYTLNTGCAANYTITVLPQPAAIITPLGDTNICKGHFVALTANTGIGLTYQWYAGGLPIAGATNSSYISSPIVNTSYTVYVSSGVSGCSATSIPMLVSIIPVPKVIYTLTSPTFCTGGSVKIHANIGAGLSYQWVNVTTGVISGATDSTYTTSTAGSYEAVITNATGCSDTSNIITVVINPLPPGIVIPSGPLAICNGDSVILRGDKGDTYTWFKGGVAIGGATYDSLIVKTAGAYKVTETTGAGCSATSAIFTVTVNPLPVPPTLTASGPKVFCAGGAVTLTVSSAVGETFQWYDNGLPITGATATSLLVTSNGMYKAMVTTSLGCSAMSPVDSIYVVATPTIVAPSSDRFCWGGSAELIVTVIGGSGVITYQWDNSGTPIPGATNAIFYATTAGIFTCVVSVPSSCSISSSSVSVIENPLPNPLITFDGTTFHTQNFFVTYQWFKGLAAIYGAIDSTTAAIGNDDYKVEVTDTNGCQSFSDVYRLSGWSAQHTGVKNVTGADVRIYPNPAQTVVHVEAPADVRAIISAIDGRKLIEQPAAKDIDITELANGIYMITIYDANGLLLKTEKLMKSAN
jgi:uncharacterized protein YjdB